MTLTLERYIKKTQVFDRKYTDNNMYVSIRYIAKILGINVRTIRIYMDKQLISGLIYQKRLCILKRDISRLICIRRLSRDFGINVAGIKLILAILDSQCSASINLDKLISKYTDKCEMGDDYVEFRQKVFKTKYHKCS